MSNVLLEATHISHNFDYTLFTDIDFRLLSHQSAAIVGRSGSGKSTLLHIFSTFMKPNSGTVTLFGEDLYTLNEQAIEALRRYDIGIIFQFHYLFKGMRALENIHVATMLSGDEIDHTLLKKLEIDHLMSHKTSELSGGEQQRVGIARAVVNRPPILLADEPTGNLDPKLSKEIMMLLADFNAVGVTTIIATHDIQLAKKMQRRMVVLHQGKLIEAGIPGKPV